MQYALHMFIVYACYRMFRIANIFEHIVQRLWKLHLRSRE